MLFLVSAVENPNASDSAALPPPIPVILVNNPLSSPYSARLEANIAPTSPMLSPPSIPASRLFLTLSST